LCLEAAALPLSLQFIEIAAQAQENSQRKSAIHLFAFPSSVKIFLFFVAYLFYFCRIFPRFGQQILLAKESTQSVCYLQILILIVIHIYVLCGFLFQPGLRLLFPLSKSVCNALVKA